MFCDISLGHSLFRMVNEFNKAKNTNQIRKLLNLLGNDFAISRDSNKRKGGLIGLAAVSIGLGKVCYFYQEIKKSEIILLHI